MLTACSPHFGQLLYEQGNEGKNKGYDNTPVLKLG